MRGRHIRMSDELWEALASLAARNGRTIAEELRIATETHLKLAGNITVNETRKTKSPHPNARQL
jgi:predicted DNA-binding protein